MKRLTKRPLLAAAAVFCAHAIVVAAVQLSRPTIGHWGWVSLRNFQEQILDQPAYQAWWYVQANFTRQFGYGYYALKPALGSDASAMLFTIVWYSVLGGAPYAIAAALVVRWLRGRARGPQEIAA